MANYLTIDGGTTNTRVNLVLDGMIADSLKLNIGVKMNVDGSEKYKQEIKSGIETLLKNNEISESYIERIICSGMITSELGLCPLEHLVVPCGINELHDGLHEVTFDEISKIPFVFVRGVRTKCDILENSDIMRGEETELIGITDKTEPESLYVLPGSHSKLIYTDDVGRICGFSTELSGELIDAVANNTILKENIDLKQNDFDEEYLQKGYVYARDNGVNAGFFKVRILKTRFSCNDNQLYSFFIGVALSTEIESIIKSAAKKVVIGGKKQLKLPMATLLENNSAKEVVCVSDDIAANAATYGMIKIYERGFK